MTTIGTAVLQIIPSLKGVTAEIEKQLDGKTIEVPVQPKVDKPATKKAGEDLAKGVTEGAKAGGEAAADNVTKPITEAAKKAGADAGKAIDAEVTKATKDTGTKVGQTVNESISRNAKAGGLKQAAIDAAKEFEKGLVSGVTSGITSAMSGGRLGVVMTDNLTSSVKDAVANSTMGETLGSQVTDKLIDGVSDAFKGSSIGQTITGALNTAGVDIGGVVEPIIGAIDPLRASLEAFKTRDVAGGLQSAVTALQGLESIGVPPEIASGLQGIVSHAQGAKDLSDNISSLAGAAQELGGKSFGKGTKFGDSLDTLVAAAGPIGLTVAAAGELDTQLSNLGVAKFTEVPGSATWFLHQLNNGWPGIKDLVQDLKNIGGALNNLTGGVFESARDKAQDALNNAQHDARIAQDPGHGGRAGGGMIPGFSLTDDRLGVIGGRGLIGLAGGEGIINAKATRNLGGARMISWLNGFADGGIVPPDVAAAQALAGTGYSQGARTDCSGMVARVIDRTLGMPEAGLMSTKTAAEWLAARGFVPGSGGPGQVSVGWYDHGPNPNDGHMAMTLSDGRNAEAGGSSGVFTIGGSAAGASSPQFDQHMHLPTVYGEGPAGSSSASSPFAGGSAAAATGAAPASGGPAAAPASSTGSRGGSIGLPSSISGLATMGLDSLPNPTAGLPDTLPNGSKNPWKQESAKKFGEAASAAVGGQVQSALGVLGVPNSPGWLKGISTLIGGISIGGGGSANPLAASPNGTKLPGDAANMHGTQAGQPPGPTYNVYARDAEDAVDRLRRLQDKNTAAKLDHL